MHDADPIYLWVVAKGTPCGLVDPRSRRRPSSLSSMNYDACWGLIVLARSNLRGLGKERVPEREVGTEGTYWVKSRLLQ